MSVRDEDLTDVETRLREALAPLRGTTLPERTAREAVARGRRLRRGRRAATAAAPLVAAALVVATALGIGFATGRDDGAATGPAVVGPGWHRAAASPLSPRLGAWVLPLGTDRVLVLGGSAEDPCPPNASCAAPTQETPLPRDGAVYDVRTDTWRRIADAPVPLGFAASAVVGDTVYVLTNPGQFGPDAVDQGERTLLAWSAADDRWTRLPAPQAQVAGLVALDDGRLLAFGSAQEDGTPADHVYDTATRTWTALPQDPLPGVSGRTVLAVPGGAVRVAEAPADGKPYGTWLLARWDAAANAWTRWPDPRIAASSPLWFSTGGRVVNPSGETVDAGPLGLRPTGGIIDPATGASVPVPPFAPEPGVQPSAAGAGRVVALGGVLDVAARRWSDLPHRPGDRVEQAGAGVTPGGVLVEFGGVRAEGDGAWTKAALSDELWVLGLP